MTLFLDALNWIFDPANYVGDGSIPSRLLEHLVFTFVTLLMASMLALPLGFLIGHTGRGRGLAVAVSGGLRALPTLGLLTLVALWVGIGLEAPYVALTVLAIPPVLAGAYTGFEAIDRATIDAARSVGMSEWQIVRKVEIPLGLPLLIGGLRSGTLQVVATATLAAYVADFGLGRFLFSGLKTRDYAEMLGGSILVILLALVLEGIFSVIHRVILPRGVAAGRPTEVRAGSVRPRPGMESTIAKGRK
ncbi:ABC transporter permease subunit [Cryobacterium sp. Sr8]|uniref:Osmoprotectant transport system permease protein n=1 Tax=Cryobacterium psychrotolerans TaxID=386301 RepID=A0A1G9G3Q4_9MICO|nr:MULTISPECIES: ABC transporter permease subunit [Cryobacterium]TFD44196.1 ABC transporter permease subunit [Cryobacterium sp. TMT1-2-1]TFD77931.1 ABC transporter permease subunit [Cryobacterium sp. Sr8]TFD89361.1 ABC transporter permease subunit [Cryobacterium psychrotolerans]SDK95318.1 osmoprotectant transport system permease protein [Cryobacterium psychrotolerans]